MIILYYLLASHIRQWKGYTVGRTAESSQPNPTRSVSLTELSNNILNARQRLRNPFAQYRVSTRIRRANSPPETVIVANPRSDVSKHNLFLLPGGGSAPFLVMANNRFFPIAYST